MTSFMVDRKAGKVWCRCRLGSHRRKWGEAVERVWEVGGGAYSTSAR